MPLDANLCKNRFVNGNDVNIMLQVGSIYTKGPDGNWNDNDMINIMLEVARTLLKILGSDIFDQLRKTTV